ncbi:PLD nuclease N-terminal domain-containing protein [Nocardia sp. IFM 10818]
MTTTILASAATLAAGTAETAGSIALAVGLIAVAIAGVVLFIAAVVSVLRSRNYQAGGKAMWILLILVFPVLAPIVWFIWGRNSTIMSPPPSAV